MRTKFRYGVPVAEAVRFFVCDAESLFAELIVAIKQARNRREAPSH